MKDNIATGDTLLSGVDTSTTEVINKLNNSNSETNTTSSSKPAASIELSSSTATITLDINRTTIDNAKEISKEYHMENNVASKDVVQHCQIDSSANHTNGSGDGVPVESVDRTSVILSLPINEDKCNNKVNNGNNNIIIDNLLNGNNMDTLNTNSSSSPNNSSGSENSTIFNNKHAADTVGEKTNVKICKMDEPLVVIPGTKTTITLTTKQEGGGENSVKEQVPLIFRPSHNATVKIDETPHNNAIPIISNISINALSPIETVADARSAATTKQQSEISIPKDSASITIRSHGMNSGDTNDLKNVEDNVIITGGASKVTSSLSSFRNSKVIINSDNDKSNDSTNDSKYNNTNGTKLVNDGDSLTMNNPSISISILRSPTKPITTPSATAPPPIIATAIPAVEATSKSTITIKEKKNDKSNNPNDENCGVSVTVTIETVPTASESGKTIITTNTPSTSSSIKRIPSLSALINEKNQQSTIVDLRDDSDVEEQNGRIANNKMNNKGHLNNHDTTTINATANCKSKLRKDIKNIPKSITITSNNSHDSDGAVIIGSDSDSDERNSQIKSSAMKLNTTNLSSK